jgi:hypothetical protein
MFEFRKGVRGERFPPLETQTRKLQLGTTCRNAAPFAFSRKELGTCFDAMADG